MGSTLALLLLKNNHVTLAHIGDSRIYRLRANRLELLTHDHSLLQEQIDQGILSAEAAATSHNRHLVTRGLGLQAEVDVALDACEALPGDLYLLCSDGLNDMVDNADIELVLNSLQANLPLAASQLVMIANDNGGEDNISVILAKVGTHTYARREEARFLRLAIRTLNPMAKLIVSQNGTVTENRFLNDASFTIGSLPDSDLCLAVDGVSRSHARITSSATMTSWKTWAAPMAPW